MHGELTYKHLWLIAPTRQKLYPDFKLKFLIPWTAKYRFGDKASNLMIEDVIVCSLIRAIGQIKVMW
jgi:hypothetical protein